jgi:anti-anti-sigma regulatory factor
MLSWPCAATWMLPARRMPRRLSWPRWRGGQYLVIDMSAVDFIDCSSLGAMLRVQGQARRGGDMVLTALQPHARRLLALTGKDEAFRGQASVESAVAGIAGRRRRYPRRRLAVRTARPGRAVPSRTGTG